MENAPKKQGQPAKDEKKTRLEAALRRNLKRRKAATKPEKADK